MDREEAIRCFWYFSNVADSGNNVVALTRRDKEAFNMAIEALSAEPCEDAISRADTIEWLKRVTVTDGITFETGFKQILTDIQNMPPVTPKQKMGHWEWIQYDSNPKIGNWHCSECMRIVVMRVSKEEEGGIPLYEYCPYCGAKMSENTTGSNCSEKPNKWIPVSERLPEKTGLYLVSIGDLVCSKSFDGHNFRTESQVRFIPDAWMPLPEPYKAESEDTDGK